MKGKKQKATHDGAAVLGFHVRVRAEREWLDNAAALLRGAYAVLRQVDVDRKARLVSEQRPELLLVPRAKLQLTSVLLAALATENALKGAIVARGLLPQPGDDLAGYSRVPKIIAHHDLAQLARDAKVTPADAFEREAIEKGELYITGFGRYHITRDVSEYPDRQGGTSTDPFALVPAYCRLYLAAVEVVAREEAARERYDRRQRKLHVERMRWVFKMLASGVYHAPREEAFGDLFFKPKGVPEE